MKRNITIWTVIGLMFLLSGCKEENPDEVDINHLANEQLMGVMDSYYLWYDKMPTVNYTDYDSPIELLDALMYKELDRWSYITTKQELEAYYQAAEYVGYGFGMAFDAENKLWFTFIFKDSPLRAFGVDRGWRITAIDGISPTPNNVNSLFSPNSATFTMINLEGETVSQAFTKRVVTMNTVLMDSVYTSEATKVGYFVLKGFVDPTVVELDEVYARFIEQGVNELIVDLRYNGGGSVAAASHLANLMAGSLTNDKILGRYVHNDKQTSRNVEIPIKKTVNSLSINRVVFITTRNSASASELVINGLMPHLDITLVGSRTYGKPVGMYAFTSEAFDWAFVPISFKIINANNQGDYYNGIPVDIAANDGINHPFGDINEPSLNAAFHFITSTAPKLEIRFDEILKYPSGKGLQGEIGAW